MWITDWWNYIRCHSNMDVSVQCYPFIRAILLFFFSSLSCCCPLCVGRSASGESLDGMSHLHSKVLFIFSFSGCNSIVAPWCHGEECLRRAALITSRLPLLGECSASCFLRHPLWSKAGEIFLAVCERMWWREQNESLWPDDWESPYTLDSTSGCKWNYIYWEFNI